MKQKQSENQIKISVIMPVYKVEEYVSKAIESILHQRDQKGEAFAQWEMILIDDGTPDRSGEICDSYAGRDGRITVIHQENSGAPAARNHGIQKAKGEYLYFMDSDDWCEPTMLSDLYTLAKSHDSQLVISGFYIDTYYDLKRGKYITGNYIPEDGVFRSKEAFQENAYQLFDKNMLYSPWNKLYLREYIVEHNLLFPETFWDDFPFVLSVIRDIERVSVTSKQYYHFLRARTESETARYVSGMYQKRQEEHQWMMDLYDRWNLWEKTENREMVSRRYLDRLIGCFENLTNPNCKLTLKEKWAEGRRMLKASEVEDALKDAKPRSTYGKVMYLPIRWKSLPLIMLEAKVITWVKEHNMKVFARLKTNR